MVKKISIFVEGGGDSKTTWIKVRKSFRAFLKNLVEIADKKKIDFKIKACGPRGTAKNDFFMALESDPDIFNVLLVDSESPVNKAPWKHLSENDKWELQEIHKDSCHLMVQVMESWLIADIEALKNFYGNRFDESKIPNNKNVEKITKKEVLSSLELASKNTTVGKYHKIHHGPKLLERVDVARVRDAALHCERLFNILTKKMSL